MAVIGIFGYLLVYFFIFTGCEELIKFWVLGNLLVMVAIEAVKLVFILIFKGKAEFRNSIRRRSIAASDRSLLAQSRDDTLSFKLQNDFYSLTYFSYIYIDKQISTISLENQHLANESDDDNTPMLDKSHQSNKEFRLTE